MEKSLTKYVDVFYGNGASVLPKPEGIAATWFFIKAQCGNTHPHAALPFGRMTCGLYTGGYPTGYGNHLPNSCGGVPTFPAKARGFSHLHQTGTGAIGTYYNYAVTTPLYGEIREIGEDFTDEAGEPGYYTATFSESGIRTEITVSETAAYHRYHFDGTGKIMIDFSNDGLCREFGDGYFDLPKEAEICIERENAVSARVILHDVPLYFYAVCEGNVKQSSLWSAYKETEEKVLQKGETEDRFGAVFTVEDTAVLRMAVSAKSKEEAKNMADGGGLFDDVRRKASEKWEAYLGKIEIEADEETKRMFYSNLYHSLLKPSRIDDTYTDFATFWDMYKTQLPLVFSLFEEESRGISKALSEAGKTFGVIPNALMLSDDHDRFEKQGKMLATHIMADAYYHGMTDAESVLSVAKGEMPENIEACFAEMCEEERFTHVLDIAEGFAMAEAIARENEKTAEAAQFEIGSRRWRDAFSDDGLLKEGKCYYEGDQWNYSFRLLHRMEERIAVCGKEEFIKKADSFFGYGKAPIEQCKKSNCAKYIRELQLHRFDGINNEHDMEAPFAYVFAGRHDKTCEITRAIMQYMFTKGRGGLPGNNDTGALSSWYVWNCIGLFPVAGQDKVLIASPTVKEATLHLASGKTVAIRVHGTGIYVEKATWDGKELQNMQVPVREMMQGGTLYIYLKEK